MAWQIAFLAIGSSPARFRPLMISSIVEKLGHVAGVAVPRIDRGRASRAGVQELERQRAYPAPISSSVPAV
jgi:hypothetical protein